MSYDLGVCLRPCRLERVVASPEEKARATASAVAEVLGVRVVTDERLREVRRPWTEGNFADAVARYLEGDLIEGSEPVEQVLSRLGDSLVSHSGNGPIGVVAHGTAIACLLGADASVDRVHFWADQTMPDAWTLSGKSLTRLYRLEA